MKIKIALTGTVSISKVHAQAALLAGAELTAVVNHRPDSLAEFAKQFHIPRRYETIEDLLQDGGVEALIVCTPNYLHAPQTIRALQAGIPVLVEKPMAMNAVQAQEMCQAAQDSGAALMVAHCWRFDEDVLWLKRHSPQIGRIIRTKSYGVHALWGPSGWFTHKEWAGGGAMADMGIHAVDTTRFLLGDPQPVAVYARIGTYYMDAEVDDTGVILVNWDNGVTSYIESGWWQPHSDGPEAATQLYGQRGFAQLFPTRLELLDASRQKIELLDSGLSFPRPEHGAPAMYQAQMAYFLNCIRSQAQPVPGGRDGLINMRIVDAAYESSRTGKVIDLG